MLHGKSLLIVSVKPYLNINYYFNGLNELDRETMEAICAFKRASCHTARAYYYPLNFYSTTVHYMVSRVSEFWILMAFQSNYWQCRDVLLRKSELYCEITLLQRKSLSIFFQNKKFFDLPKKKSYYAIHNHDEQQFFWTCLVCTCHLTVWPEPTWIKVKKSWQIPLYQSTYLGGPESASIEIPPFRPQFTKFSKIVLYEVNLVS